MDDPQRTPVAGVVITVLVLIVGAYLLAPDDDTEAEPSNTTIDSADPTNTTVYPGDPSLPDPGSGGAHLSPDPGGPVTSTGDDTWIVINRDDDGD